MDADGNPYAPPVAPAEPSAEPEGPLSAAEIAEARADLAAHLDDPARARGELRRAGRLPGAVVLLGLVVASALTVIGGVAGWGPFAVLPLLALAAAVMVLRRLGDARRPRHPRRDPERALRAWLASLRTGHAGYALATLVPGARLVVAPRRAGLPNVHLGRSARQLERCLSPALSGLARRQLRATSVRHEHDDLAWVTVASDAVYLPWYMQLVPFIAALAGSVAFTVGASRAPPFAFFAVFAVAHLATARWGTRRIPAPPFTKAFLRGGDGLWYLIDGRRLDDLGGGATDRRQPGP